MSDEMIPSPTSQWDYQMPYYHHQTSSEFTLPFYSETDTESRINQALLRDDHIMLTHQSVATGQTIPSPEIGSSSSSCPGNPSVGESRSPKNGVAKPVRRRSRASKKAPTTLLNASLTNFRSLVQEYTGCHSSSSHSSILRNQRGPITLSFGPPAGNDFQTSGEQGWHHEQEQQQAQGQQLMVSYNHNSFVDSSPTYSGVDNNNNTDRSSKSSNPSTSIMNYDEWQ